mgnify:CR=1 FL=1
MNILITGASGGIGEELVKEYAKDKNNEVVAISRDIEKLNKIKQYCHSHYSNSIDTYQLDFLSSKFSHELKNILNKYSHFDIVVNNAGCLLNKPFEEFKVQDIENIFKVNVYAPIQICQEVIALNNNRSCHIINIGSMGGYQGSVKFPGLSIYSASKAALANLTECLAEEYKETNLIINCLALGSVQTEMLNKAFSGFKAQFSPLQIANYIALFSLNAQKLYNGKVLPVSNSTP